MEGPFSLWMTSDWNDVNGLLQSRSIKMFGEALREELYFRNMTVCTFAEKMNQPLQEIKDLLEDKLPMTQPLAEKLSQVLGVSVELCLNLGRKLLEAYNPVYRKGIQNTIRNGLKWSEVPIGQGLLLAKTGGPIVVEATVVGSLYMRARDVVDDIIKLNHDPAAQTRDGLYRAMRLAYGEEWSDDSFVTVLFFEVK